MEATNPTWDAPHLEEAAEASTAAWAKIAAGTALADLTPEELYVVYVEVTEAAQKMGVAA